MEGSRDLHIVDSFLYFKRIKCAEMQYVQMAEVVDTGSRTLLLDVYKPLRKIRVSLVQVHLDHKHMGIGGDDSWTPCVHPQYIVPPQLYQFSIRLSPLTRQSSPLKICQTQLENVS